jgi:hypothetical protein
VHPTLYGAPGQPTNEQATLGNSLGSLRYNSLDCPVCTRLSDEPAEQRLPVPTVDCKSLQWQTESRISQKPPDSPADYPVQQKDKGSNGQLLQTLTGVLTWRALDSKQWLSGVPIASSLCQRLESGWVL